VPDLEGNQVPLSNFKGAKAILVVNVACACGLTSDNYKQLVELYQQYKDKGFVVWGFPCNQFGQQESGTEKQIREFVTNTFNVTFPVFAKVEVNGPKTHQLYQFLRANSPLFDKLTGKSKYISWNFGKFLLNGEGKVIEYYKPTTEPNQILPDVKNLLGV
jgi:glutathione peroxidase